MDAYQAAMAVVNAARELDLIRDTPDDRLMVMGLKKVRAAIREYDEFMEATDGKKAQDQGSEQASD